MKIANYLNLTLSLTICLASCPKLFGNPAHNANLTPLAITHCPAKQISITNPELISDPQVAIIGSGPGGMGAAIYLGRANGDHTQRNIMVIEGELAGGTPMKAGKIQNYPGVPDAEGIEGPELMANMRAQALQNNVGFVAQKVTKVDFSSTPYKLELSGGQTIKSPAVIIATGNKPISTNAPGEKEYIGKGVAFCANCDGPFFKNKVIAVIGGGYGALRETGQLLQFASQIFMINKNDQLKGPDMLLKHANDPKVTVLNNCDLIEIVGNGAKVCAVKYTDLKTKAVKTLDVDGVFVALGQVPNSHIFKDQVKLNDKNEIIVDCQTLQTSVPGVWAVGDVTDKSMHQIPTAMGEGYKAGLNAESYLKKLKTK